MAATDPLAPLITACALPPGRERLRQSVAALAEVFRVDPLEIALLRLESDILVFLAPERLGAFGSIPLSAASTSVAARIAKSGRADLDNRFAATPHASVFEGVKLGQNKLPIQKLLGAPILRQGQTVGVVQISRKAKNAADVPDFTNDDLMRLTRAAELLATIMEAP